MIAISASVAANRSNPYIATGVLIADLMIAFTVTDTSSKSDPLIITGIVGGFPRYVAMSFVVKGRSDIKNNISRVRRYEWGVSCFIRLVTDECDIQALPINAKLMR
jgi:hypothetical protein